MLLTTRKHPPGGFPYTCGKCGWEVANPLNTWTEIVKEITRHRANNPTHSLSISAQDIEHDLSVFTCARLHNSPKWCDSPTQENVQSTAKKTPRSGCAGCGRRKKAA